MRMLRCCRKGLRRSGGDAARGKAACKYVLTYMHIRTLMDEVTTTRTTMVVTTTRTTMVELNQ